jgi:glycosyltransferase involved in cell wall biosynthesis
MKDVSVADGGPLRIVHVSSVDLGIWFLRPQLQALVERGHTVHAFCGPGPYLEPLTRMGVAVTPIEVSRTISPFADLRLLLQLVRLLRNGRYTILHAHTAKLEVVAQLAGRIAGVPVVLYTNHGFIFRSDMKPGMTKFLRGMAKLGGRLADHVLSQSAEDIQVAVAEGIYPADKVSYLGNGIDIEGFDITAYPDPRRRAKKQEIGIPQDRAVVGMVGRYVWEKGYREFFEAAKTLVESGRPIHFLTVGNALESERDPVDFAILRELGIEDHVTVLRARNDMADLYSVMDVVVLPSYREGFPRTLMEAAAMSRPTVATDISGCREAVTHGETGFLVPVRDAAQLAARIATLLDDPTLAASFGASARALAEDRFDERRVVQRLLACYEELLERRPIGGGRLRREISENNVHRAMPYALTSSENASNAK